MPNNHFRFKEFIVKQDKCAMKVCTDACLFGAWAAAQHKGISDIGFRISATTHHLPLTTHTLLDIGTGTGLLSLMLAQKNPDAIIDAVEIDDAAAQQARENFEASPWKERLHVFNLSVQEFAETINKKYDVIISNPPFYESDLKSDDAKRNLALHSSELKLEELISVADRLLNDGGSFFLLLPYHRTKDLETLIEKKFFVQEKVLVKQTEKHGWFRGMWWLKRSKVVIAQSEIVITKNKHYSNEFTGFLKDYYLHL